MQVKDWLAVGLLALAVIVPILAMIGRLIQSKGIGWQFIRFNAIIVAVPVAGILALYGLLTEGAVAIMAGVVGYAFGKNGSDE
jgi:hypothetical protein